MAEDIHVSSDQDKEDLADLNQYVSFNLGDDEFGVDILRVQEINKMMDITRVPNTPVFVDGVINLRGRIIPVIDLRTKLNLERKEHTSDSRIIVVELSDKTVGFVVDEVKEVLRMSKERLEPPPPILSGIESDFIEAVGKMDNMMIIILDLEKVFRPLNLRKSAS